MKYDEKVKNGVYCEHIRTDKHGNKVYRTNMCKKCCGLGYIPGYFVDNGTCWKCNGSGKQAEWKMTEYTPEQMQLRQEKQTAKRVGSVESQLAKMGFGKDGLGYIPRGNTYPFREQIRAIGGVWHSYFWLSPIKPDFIDSIEVKASEVTEVLTHGQYVTRQVVLFTGAMQKLFDAQA